MDIIDFQQAWSQGRPVVVSDVQMEATGPDYFIKRFPDMKVDLEDCETGERLRWRPKVSEFLPDFGRSIDPTKTWKLKVYIQSRFSNAVDGFAYLTLSLQDWPPNALFRTTFAHLFGAFMGALPCPDMCRSDGIKNLAAHMPTNIGPMPDLGV